MKLFDSIILRAFEILSRETPKTFAYSRERTWPELKNELVMGREAAYELGAGGLSSVSFALITTDGELVPRDEILLYGRDLGELKGDSPFARITVLLTDEPEGSEQAAYEMIKALELCKYEVHPKGYMIRASALTNREQVRLSKASVKNGISFENIGNLFISKYKENTHVIAVKIIFISLKEAHYPALDALADSTNNITKALNHILDDLDVDCDRCSFKAVCEEVEGIREMHFRQGRS